MKLTLNLARRRYYDQEMVRRWLYFFLIVLLLLLVFFGYQWLTTRQQITIHQASIEELRRNLGLQPDLLAPEVLTDKYSDYRIAQQLLQRDSFRWTELFDRFEQLLPQGISLRSFQPDYQGNRLRVDGVALDLRHLQALLDQLLAEHFTQVYLRQHSNVQVSDGRGGQRSALNFSLEIEGVFL